jgi:hypothetical protein
LLFSNTQVNTIIVGDWQRDGKHDGKYDSKRDSNACYPRNKIVARHYTSSIILAAPIFNFLKSFSGTQFLLWYYARLNGGT